MTLADFEPDPTVTDLLGLDPARPIAVLRPPATMSLYHRGIENTLFDDVLAYLRASDAQIVLLPQDTRAGADVPGHGRRDRSLRSRSMARRWCTRPTSWSVRAAR